MGRRGPPPTPTEILRLRGSWRAKTRDGEVQFVAGTPTCPDWLSGEAKKEWRRIVKQLNLVGILCETDRAMLAAYCDAWAEFVQVTQELASLGRLIKTPSGAVIQSPLVPIRNKAVERLALLRREYDLSPYVREYDPEEAHPTWFLDGWMPREQMVRMARRMREQARRSVREPGWIPGHGSMVEYAVKRQSLAMVDA